MSERPRILIADDETQVREVLAEYFASQGYTIEAAADGLAAVDAFRRHRPDLILLDVRMPGLSGVEVLRRIHATDADVPVVIVSTTEDRDLARDLQRSGAVDTVAKPFDFAHLDRVVAAALARAREQVTAAAWTSLALAVFRAVRAMPDGGRASTGERLEATALAATREAAAQRPEAAGRLLRELRLLLQIALELGDLSVDQRAAIEGAVAAASKTLPA